MTIMCICFVMTFFVMIPFNCRKKFFIFVGTTFAGKRSFINTALFCLFLESILYYTEQNQRNEMVYRDHKYTFTFYNISQRKPAQRLTKCTERFKMPDKLNAHILLNGLLSCFTFMLMNLK